MGKQSVCVAPAGPFIALIDVFASAVDDGLVEQEKAGDFQQGGG